MMSVLKVIGAKNTYICFSLTGSINVLTKSLCVKQKVI